MRQRTVLVNVHKTQSLNIEFSNIKYSVSMGFHKKNKTILNGIDGYFKSNELTVIMGPSGAGKSSLLNILTGMQKNGVTGNLKFSSSQTDYHKNQYRKQLCYIKQDDILHPFFTIQEVMVIAADLKIGNSLNRKAKQMVIDDILETLDLMKTKRTPCDCLSGGQRKRLSIALELVDNPPVMFLDEPTTGLDSLTSLQCISMLQKIARCGRTIVCTIHQPSASLYDMFDHVYFLAEGRCVYQGNPKNTINYLKKVGLHCPMYHNPADYIIEVINKEYGNINDRLADAVNEFDWRIATSEIKDSKFLYHTNSILKYSEEGKTNVLITAPSELYRFWVLLHRFYSQLFRDWTVIYLKLALHILVGMLLGILYINTGADGSKSINNVGLILFNMIYICYTSLIPAVVRFPTEMPILKKEHFNNWYKLRTYYAAFLVANIPIQFLFVIVQSALVYFISDQPPVASRYLMYLLVAILVALVAESFGLVLGTTVDPINGTFLGAIITCIFMVFAGFLVLFNDMPRFMYYVTYLSYLRYAFEAMVHAIYGFNRPNLPCPSVDDLEYCHYRMPKAILQEFAVLDVNYWTNIGILIGFFIVVRFINYFILKRKLSMID